jgi:hypothetical protein
MTSHRTYDGRTSVMIRRRGESCGSTSPFSSCWALTAVHPFHPQTPLFYPVDVPRTDSYQPPAEQTGVAKGKVFLEIFQTVSCFGRFLCIDSNTGLYYEVNEYVAKEKISHALRYRKKRMSKHQRNPARPPVGASTSSLGELLATERKARFKAAASRFCRLRQSRPQSEPSLANRLELFSDEDLASVLGGPWEYDWPESSPSNRGFSTL